MFTPNYSPRFITGVIPRERLPVFERVLWRVCHGNVFLREAEIEEYLEDPSTVRTFMYIYLSLRHLKVHNTF